MFVDPFQAAEVGVRARVTATQSRRASPSPIRPGKGFACPSFSSLSLDGQKSSAISALGPFAALECARGGHRHLRVLHTSQAVDRGQDGIRAVVIDKAGQGLQVTTGGVALDVFPAAGARR
ncbi:hypothetical protein PV341_18965 [Streptomyces sp. PA03-1a]|nr:hypothetical protein [Streptomyces sp. PA03-1a]